MARVPEDPVTGSTHTVLAPCWGERLGKETMVARQCSEMEHVMKRAERRLEIRERARLFLSGSIVV